MNAKTKGRGGTYSRTHRGETPPGTHAGTPVNYSQQELDKARKAWEMGLSAQRHGKRLSKGASRVFRIAKGLLRKHGIIPS